MQYLTQFIYAVTAPLRMLAQLPVGLISAPRRLMGMSLPARVAVVLSILLIILVVVAFVAGILSKGAADVWQWFGLQRMLAIVALLIVIPIVAYVAVKLWLEGSASEFPDIDRAWKEGLAALEAQGLDPTALPIFLVMGVSDERQVKTLFEASQQSFVVSNIPQGPAALHWYATPEAIFLACTNVTRTGRLVRMAADAVGRRAAAPVAASATPRQADVLRGTIVAGGSGDLRESAAVPADIGPEQAAPSAPNLRGTLMVSPEATSKTMAFSERGPSAPPTSMISLSAGEAAELSARLAYVCQLLQRLRQPVVPANGIVALLPFDLIQKGPAEGIQVQRCVKGDLETVSQGLKLRCPVTALMVGMESEPGFRELVRRVGPERAKAQRFGKGFNVWNPPIPEQVEAVAANACGAFEDWAYLLFRERDGLTRPGNTKLYSLLCKIRTHLRTRLTNILVSAFAEEGAGKSATEGEPLMFSGCYFAAAGDTPDRQAFIKGVFDKLLDEEEELEWTQAALDENDRYHRLANTMLVFDGLLLIALVAIVVAKWWPLVR